MYNSDDRWLLKILWSRLPIHATNLDYIAVSLYFITDRSKKNASSLQQVIVSQLMMIVFFVNIVVLAIYCYNVAPVEVGI